MESTALKQNAWGGARVGAGAPISSRTLETQKIRELMLKRLKPRAKKVFDALIDAAENGDVAATRLLFEYSLGKPKEQIEHTGNMGILHLISSLEKQTNARTTES
ncbi:MAG: hypothetical protein NT019_01090 [Candidatus Adlerbacteria bacterium]|nr:hypothetical protein [Candidatus Adlerbacteria bacterium]